MTEYVDDELPLPPFAEIFGEGSMSNKKKSKKLLGARGDPNGDETTGRWTQEEHRLFLEGIMLYGKDWKKMQPLIKTRTLVQIRTHAQKVFKKIGLKKLGAGSKSKAAALAAAAAASGNHHMMDTINSQQMVNVQHHEHDGMTLQNLMGSNVGMYSNNNNINQHHYSGSSSTGSEQQHDMTASMMMPLTASTSHHNVGNVIGSSMNHQLSQQQSQYFDAGNGFSGGHDRSLDSSLSLLTGGEAGGLLGESASEENQNNFRDTTQPYDGEHPIYSSHPQLHQPLNSSSSSTGLYSGGVGEMQGLCQFAGVQTGLGGGQYLSTDKQSSPSSHGLFGASGTAFSLLGPDSSLSILSGGGGGYVGESDAGGGALLSQHMNHANNNINNHALMSNAAAADMLNSLGGEEDDEEDEEEEDDVDLDDEDDDDTLDDDSRQQLFSALTTAGSTGGFDVLQQTANSVFQHHQQHHTPASSSSLIVSSTVPSYSSSHQKGYTQQHSQQPFHTTLTNSQPLQHSLLQQQSQQFSVPSYSSTSFTTQQQQSAQAEGVGHQSSGSM